MAEPAPRPHRFHARVLSATTLPEIAREIGATASDPEGVGIMTRKGRIFAVRLDEVSLKAAPILKQELLSVGGDAAHARGVADHSVAQTPVVLLATWGQYRRLLPKLRRQPFRLAELSEELDRALRSFVAHGPRPLKAAHRTITLGDRPRVMGVVNVTPDSFSDGGRYLAPDLAVARAETMASEGADVIDIGGESTRPGATSVSAEVEWKRVGPVLDRLRGRFKVPLSIDTRHAEVAAKAVEAGADLVNDVEGLRTEEMRRVVARTGAAAVVMHMRGTPETMQSNTDYVDLRGEVYRTLAAATDRAVADGIEPDRLLIDPGLGFGKTAAQSLELLWHADEFRSLGFPVLLGASRKSFLGWALGSGGPLDRMEAGLAAAVLAAERGVDLVRTHDVRETVRALQLVARGRTLAESAALPAEPLATTEPDF
ncbi:MAG TPA: dihydropteroate synthase [Thermoplasmata archaeon]|nr:dihydropteroate synthase [Thermoplasmata archaeon]